MEVAEHKTPTTRRPSRSCLAFKQVHRLYSILLCFDALLTPITIVEHFWHIYDHLVRPNDIKGTTDYHLFRDGVKPTWEDPQNQNGGKWMVRLKKGLASKYWEELVLAIIGEQFDVGNEICGAVVSTRANEDIISVWNKTNDNQEAINKIR